MKSPRHSDDHASAAPVSTRGAWRDAAVVTGAALLVRLVALFVNARSNPAFDYLIMDSMYIDRWARALVAGGEGPAVFFRGPLYPYLLALIFKVTGGSHTAAIAFNHLCGALTCGFIVLLAREYFPRRVALVAGLVAAGYWPFVYFEGELLVEPLAIVLLVLSLWRVARAARAPSVGRVLTAGVCLGLAVLARPTALVVLLVVPFVFRPVPGGGGPGRWRATILTAAACLALLIPPVIHNYRGARAIVPVAWSGGLNFYIGNNAASDGSSAVIPGTAAPWMGGGDEALAIATQQAGRELTPAEASSYFMHRGLDFVATSPVAALSLTLRKLFKFWEGPERSNEKYIYFFWQSYGLGRVPMAGFWLIAPLALVGLARLWPRRRELSLLYGFVVAYMAAVVVFFVVARLRLPAVPVLIVFASWAAVDIVAAIRGRQRGRIIQGAVLFVAAFLFCNAGYPRFALQRPTHDVISYYTLAAARVENNDADGALLELARARVAFEKAPNPRYAGIAQDIYFKLGSLLYERGRCKEASDALGRVLPSDPRANAARLMFADCCEKTGRFAEAGKAYEMVLRAAPGDARATDGLIRCLEATGKYDEAARVRAQQNR
ncbi:MAG TPA: glycosyltransferase family 39 protein [Candidatus Krumholzibacteria bacterium]|nr:glycosyltransferase family 39 protein [Candidatus Krumholzibacteria bacterium]